MDLELTAALAAVFLALAVIFAIVGARPSLPMSPPRLAPWRLMMVFAFAATVVLLVHLVGLLRSR
ncbi:MAG: hypothetical protein ACRED8_13720 [Caulobacteraceae bacterium]